MTKRSYSNLAAGPKFGDHFYAPVVNLPFTKIPLKLLFAVTSLRTPVTTADSKGTTRIPFARLLETIVFDTEKLLDVLGTILIPAFAKFRTTQFSISRW